MILPLPKPTLMYENCLALKTPLAALFKIYDTTILGYVYSVTDKSNLKQYLLRTLVAVGVILHVFCITAESVMLVFHQSLSVQIHKILHSNVTSKTLHQCQK